MRRATVSVAPPATKGTMMVMTRSGYTAPAAAGQASAPASARTSARRLTAATRRVPAMTALLILMLILPPLSFVLFIGHAAIGWRTSPCHLPHLCGIVQPQVGSGMGGMD